MKEFITKYKYWIMAAVASLALWVFGPDFKKVVIDTPVPNTEVPIDTSKKDTLVL